MYINAPLLYKKAKKKIFGLLASSLYRFRGTFWIIAWNTVPEVPDDYGAIL